MVKKTTEPAAAGRVRVRVLSACTHGQPNDVVEMDVGLAEQAAADGLVDAAPEAVAYAQSLLEADPA
jgi:hypothetical protein